MQKKSRMLNQVYRNQNAGHGMKKNISKMHNAQCTIHSADYRGKPKAVGSQSPTQIASLWNDLQYRMERNVQDRIQNRMMYRMKKRE